MKHLLAFLLALSILPATARTLYLTGEPIEDKTKVIPESERRNDADGHPTALLLVTSELEGLRFSGLGVLLGVEHDDNIYAVHLSPGTTQMAVTLGELEPLAVTLPRVASGHVYTMTVTDGEDYAPEQYRQQTGSLHVTSDAGATIEIDGVAMLTEAAADSYLTLPTGTHTVRAGMSLPAAGSTAGSTLYASEQTYWSETKSVRLPADGMRDTDVPVTGAIRFFPHAKHLTDAVKVRFKPDPEHPLFGEQPNVYVARDEFIIRNAGEIQTGMRGNYVATYSASGFKTKTSRYTVAPGQMVEAEIKLDPISGRTFIAYEFSLRSALGLNVGYCGKYFGWFGKFYLLGVKDPAWTADSNDPYAERGCSIGGQTGPMFQILRARTSLYLSVGGGYERMYYSNDITDDYDDHFVASAALTFRFPKGFALGLVWNQPFGDGSEWKTYSSLYNLGLTIGASF